MCVLKLKTKHTHTKCGYSDTDFFFGVCVFFLTVPAVLSDTVTTLMNETPAVYDLFNKKQAKPILQQQQIQFGDVNLCQSITHRTTQSLNKKQKNRTLQQMQFLHSATTL